MYQDSARPQQMSPEDYYASLPAVFVGVAVLFHDAEGRLLLVKPTYRPHWILPGGAMDPGEAPRQTAVREIAEELGLYRVPGRMLCVDFVPALPRRPKSAVVYLFDGGLLGSAEQSAIRLPADELSDHRFVDHADLRDYLDERHLRRVRAGVEARRTGVPIDLEHGYPPEEPAVASDA
jgi:8-oxo-dGTP diphosphatase